jgi:hypothetical protein
MKKLDSMDILYSLSGVNKRLDQMARSIDNTKFIDLSVVTPNNRFCSIRRTKLKRFRYEILHQIHHNVIGLTLDSFFMEHILHACRYPNLSMITINDDRPHMFSQYLRGKK